MNRKAKLAELILVESQSLKESSDVNCVLALAEELTKDAIELAKLVQEETKMKSILIDDVRDLKADVVCRTFDEGIEALKTQGPFQILLLDHDLGDFDSAKTGYGIMNWLEANPEYLPEQIQFVTANPVGRERMRVVRERLYKNRRNK